MIIFVSIFSFSIFLLGLLINRIPRLKARFYGFLDEIPSQNKIKGLSQSHKKCYILFAVISYISFAIPYYLNWHILGHFLFITTVLMGFNVVFYTQLKFYHHVYKNQFIIGIIVISISWIIIISLFTCGVWPNKPKFDDNRFVLSGMYGFELSMEDIASVEIQKNIPEIINRVDGFSLDYIHKGHYHLSDGEACTLLINSKDTPCIEIITKDNKKMVFNFRNPLVFNDVYYQLTSDTQTAYK